jgi:hypothetical protein
MAATEFVKWTDLLSTAYHIKVDRWKVSANEEMSVIREICIRHCHEAHEIGDVTFL